LELGAKKKYKLKQKFLHHSSSTSAQVCC